MRHRGLKIVRWFADEAGQDLSEYCLLLALVVLVAVGVFLKVSGGAQALWGSANNTLNSATSSTVSGGSAQRP